MKGLSRLSEKCSACPFVDKCDNKEMEALAYLPEPKITMSATQPNIADAMKPLLRETMTIIRNGSPITVYKDDIEKQLYSGLYSYMGLQYGG